MTIKRRLVISNILMILVPVVITALIGIACVGMVWYTVAHGRGLGIEHNEDFYFASRWIAKAAEQALDGSTGAKQTDRLSNLSQLMDQKAFLLIILTDDESLYCYGTGTDADEDLLKAVNIMGGEGFISNGNRELYIEEANVNGKIYYIQIFASPMELSYSTLAIVIGLAAFFLLSGVIMSIFLTNRFLTRFVFKKIEHPIDVLSNGVRQIRDGNLDYRIVYKSKDEFALICSDFNEMAVRLKQSVDLTQQNELSRKELLAGISHDLRSPLTSILAYVEGLLDGVAKTPDAQRGYLKTIKDKAEDIDRMVEKIFLFSKMEMGEYPDHPELLRLDEEIWRMLSTLGPEYEEKGLQISAGILSPATVSADPEQLRRVFVNIMENSLKYKDKETGHLVIFLEKQNNGYRISLCDDGPGVQADSLPHLFDAFYRGDPARQNPNRGSGLGLSISENAVHRMNGTIAAENGELRGLNIMIWLPEAEVQNEKNTDH